MLAPAPAGRGVRIMVTMPSEAADDYRLVHDLLQQGMDCMRINCAHDDAAAWLRMIEHLRRAERSLGRLMPGRDGPGRTEAAHRPARTGSDGGPDSPPPRCLRAGHRPRAGLADPGVCSPPAPLAGERLPSRAGDVAGPPSRGGTREIHRCPRLPSGAFRIVDVTDHGCWAEATKTAYIVPGTVLRHEHGVDKGGDREGSVGDLPPGENAILLQQGDLLILTRDLKPGRPATYDSAGQILTPAAIGCTIPEVFDDVRSGDSIWFDDGKIGGDRRKGREHAGSRSDHPGSLAR